MNKLYKELGQYQEKNIYPFHMPGHKRNPSCMGMHLPVELDITEITGFDDLHHPSGMILEAERRTARLFGAQESFFSVNGSTAAILAAISACTKRGDRVLVARNCHKSVYHALYLRGLRPMYIYPNDYPGMTLNGGISANKVGRILEENPDIRAVIIASPTYDGIVSDVERIAYAAHSQDIPLIVDEAHGAHFVFSNYFPDSAISLGGDIVIQSAHKTLPSLTQTAFLHVCSDRVDPERVQWFMNVYETSSPSYILMSSLDSCVDKLASSGKDMFRRFTRDLEEARRQLAAGRHIRLVTPSHEEDERIFDFDRSKLILSTRDSSLTGPALHRILYDEFQIEIEMEGPDYVLAMASVGDTREGFDRLCEAIETIDEREEENDPAEKSEPESPTGEKKKMLEMEDAIESSKETCLLEESIGRVAADFVYLYPPATPILVPGELITGPVIRALRQYKELQLCVTGLWGEDGDSIRTVADGD